MRLWIKILMILFLIIIAPQSIFSQSLLEMPLEQFKMLDQSRLLWNETRDQSVFLLVPDIKDLQAVNADYRLLDEDVELDNYFWLHAMGVSEFNWTVIQSSKSMALVWGDKRTALVRSDYRNISGLVPREIMVQPIHFRKLPKAPVGELHQFMGRSPENVLSAQAIIDSVNIDSIYYTERHLTGIEPFMLSTGMDSLQSRNSDNPQIFIAQQYLEERLQGYGYTVDLHPFGSGIYYDVVFAPAQNSIGWLAGTDKIYKTTDGGNSWAYSYQGSTGSELWSLYPVDQQVVYAVGNYGKILKTTDGGANWQQQTSSFSGFLFGVYFVNSDLGFIAADNGVIMKTTDGGTNWTLKSTPTSYRLYDIYFSDPSNGWAVGRNGAILHTTDSGENWVSQSSGTSTRLYGAYFLNPDTGFVVGWDGRLLKTVNGGSQWNTINVSTSNYLYGIDFIDSQNGVIAGWNGTCLKTSDGGNSWSSVGNILSADAYAVDYVDSQNLWSSGSGMFARSTDGGASWQSQISEIPEGSLNNVIATKTGTTYPDHYYIICAHYDDMPPGPLAPGADDNGSGTAAVIEAARLLAGYDFKYSIRFVLFSGEEQGLVGSSAYAAAAAASGDLIEGVINMDMIAYDSNGDGTVEIHAGTLTGSQQIGTLMVNNITTWGLALSAQYLTSGSSGASDHASFWNVGYPAIMHIEDFQDFTPYYHTTNDRLNTLNAPYFHENAKLAIGTLAVLAELDSITTGIVSGQVPRDFQIKDPYPNPFNPRVSLEYYLPVSNRVEVKVFDILGKRVNTLIDARHSAGWHRLTWDATSESGNNLASGIYFMQVKSRDFLQMKKVVLLR